MGVLGPRQSVVNVTVQTLELLMIFLMLGVARETRRMFAIVGILNLLMLPVVLQMIVQMV